MSDEEQTFTREDVQAWVDGLDERTMALLAYVGAEREFIGQMAGLSFAIEAAGQQAREHADAQRAGASRAVRGLLDVLMHSRKIFQAKDAMKYGRIEPGAVPQ